LGREFRIEGPPVRVTGKACESVDVSYQHGRLVPAVGVHNYQVYRCNRTRPEFASELTYTYNHSPMLAYWNGKFYLEFLAAPKGEHEDPTVTLLTSSIDGRHWCTPRVIFPAFTPQGESHPTIAHQRMGFYVSPGNRLLVLAFYGRWPSPNNGMGVGRAVREVYADGTIGPIYFIRYNRHTGWHEKNTPYPFYKESPDKGFVEVCQTLLADKLMTQQWWEEDHGKDGFYTVVGTDDFSCEAFNWYTRKDGKTVGLWKHAYAAFSIDGGTVWTTPQKSPSLVCGDSKVWGQRTDDGRYALLYSPHYDKRYPLAVNASDDGCNFSNMAYVHGEVPDQRYDGRWKNMGPNYVRGILPGNGNPPGNDMWVTYSVNKEDIWVSRIPVPIKNKVEQSVNDTFDRMIPDGPVDNWNIYCPKWASVQVVEFPSVVDKSLRLSNSEPYDYARAIRVFTQSTTVTVKLDVLAKQTKNGRMEIDLLSADAARPVGIVLTENAKIQLVHASETRDAMSYEPNKWLKVKISADVAASTFSLAVSGTVVVKECAFAEKADNLQRLSLRTGKYRKLGTEADDRGEDLPNAGDHVAEAVYYVNNVSIMP
jgi:hypothetical protein